MSGFEFNWNIIFSNKYRHDCVIFDLQLARYIHSIRSLFNNYWLRPLFQVTTYNKCSKHPPSVSVHMWTRSIIDSRTLSDVLGLLRTVWQALKMRWWRFPSFLIKAEIAGVFKIPRDKNLYNWVTADVGAVSRKLCVCGHIFILTFVWKSFLNLSKLFKLTVYATPLHFREIYIPFTASTYMFVTAGKKI
jgi:hypothetical protein